MHGMDKCKILKHEINLNNFERFSYWVRELTLLLLFNDNSVKWDQMNCDNSVQWPGYRMNDTNIFTFPIRETDFSLSQNDQTGCGPHPVLFIGSLSLGINRPEREINHSPPSNADLKSEWSHIHQSPICVHTVCRENVFFHGATAPSGPGPHYRGSTITLI
jgi:hypothetical protein